MLYILTPEQMRASDQAAIDECRIPSAILMENAARSAADIIRQRYLAGVGRRPSRIVVLCGPGNNGGDGFAIARHLAAEAQISVVQLGGRAKMSAEAASNFEMLQFFPLEILDAADHDTVMRTIQQADVMVDAMLGIGGGSQLRSPFAELLHDIASLPAINAPQRVAIDVPTGLDALSGEADENVLCAELTITMSAAKTGMYLREGPQACGEIVIASIGTPPDHDNGRGAYAQIEASDLPALLPPRHPNTSKFDYGRVLLLGGSESMPGAITLSANAAISAGAGLVTLCTTSLHPALHPEVMLRRLPADKQGFIDFEARELLLPELAKSDVILIGPGIGRQAHTLKLIRSILPIIPDSCTCILDADALAIWPEYDGPLPRKLICTPHSGEFARALGVAREQVTPDNLQLLQQWQSKIGATLLLKGVPSLIQNSEERYFNTGGNPGMATAGSGDVLAGIIAALAAQKLEALKAAALGAWMHSRAGDEAAQVHSQQGLRAGHIIENLAAVFSAVHSV